VDPAAAISKGPHPKKTKKHPKKKQKSTSMFVIDAAKFRDTGSVEQSVVAFRGSGFRPKGETGKAFFPPMNANVKLKVKAEGPGVLLYLEKNQVAIPESFDWRTQADLVPVQDQGPCGSCWAVSSATSMSDQWTIQKKQPSVLLAANSFTNCITGEDCQMGGSMEDAGIQASMQGVLPDSCWTYSCNCVAQVDDEHPGSPQCRVPPSKQCPKVFTQKDSVRSALVLTPAATSAGKAIPESLSDIDIPGTLALIQTSLITRGPLVTGFRVPGSLLDPFPNDPDYIFRNQRNNYVGWHAVCIVGYGKDPSGKLFWIIRNSWGSDWGDLGFFKVYAYDPEFPQNNDGYDIPVFPSETTAQATWNSKLEVLGPKLVVNPKVLVQEMFDAGAQGGVTLWWMDRMDSGPDFAARAPARSPTIALEWGLFTLLILLLLILGFWMFRNHNGLEKG